MRFAVSQDGYIRCTYHELQSAGLTHQTSGLDDDPQGGHRDRVLSGGITGYTEWVDSAAAVVTVGWDWRMHGADSGVSLVRTGDPRSNVMLVDADGADMGPGITARLLGQLIDGLEWQPAVRCSISMRYKGESI